jgi:hypothetical protein
MIRSVSIKPRPWVALLLFLAALAAAPAWSADIYRWVDDEGRIHLSDKVPDKYKKSAVRLGDSKEYELSPGQRREAEERLARDRERRAAEELERKRIEAEEAEAPAPFPKRAARQIENECAKLRREYRRSQRCYESFRASSFATRGEEAVRACGEPVKDPAYQCGVPSGR